MTAKLSRHCEGLISYQRGVVARWQLTCQEDRIAVAAMVRSGRWRILYRGVYAAFTGPPTKEGMLWAAVRRCGPEAALSHATAAALDGISDRAARVIHVTVPAGQRTKVPASEGHGLLDPVVVHRSSRLPGAVHPARMPPRTRVEETVLDLADASRSFDSAFFWLSAACSKRLVTPDRIRAAAACRKKLRWRPDIHVALDDIDRGVFSGLERRYLLNVERPHGLPAATRQARMDRAGASAYLDNLYAEFGVAVELDGRAAHPIEERWHDIHRDNYFASGGIITLRYSWSDVMERPCLVAAEIAAVLRQRGWTGTLRGCGSGCPAAARA